MKINIKQILKQARTKYQEGKLEEVEKLYREILKTEPKHPDFAVVHYNHGNILFELNKLDEAEIAYRKTIEFKLDFVEAYNNLGNTLSKLNRLDEAEINFKYVKIKNY